MEYSIRNTRLTETKESILGILNYNPKVLWNKTKVLHRREALFVMLKGQNRQT